MSERDPAAELLTLLEREPERGVDERGSCPACLGTASKVLVDLPYNASTLSEFRRWMKTRGFGFLPPLLARYGYRVLECRACGLLWQPYVLSEELERVTYGRAKRDYEPGVRTRKWRASWRKFSYYVKQVERASSIFSLLYPKPPEAIEVLDFGAGWGEFVTAAQALGYRVSAAELNPRKRRQLARLGVPCVDLPCEQLFDVIHADQVLEHLADPGHWLAMLAEQLRGEGFIIISVPTVRRRGLARSLRRGDLSTIVNLCPLVHVNMFSGRSLRALGRRLGLTPAVAQDLLVSRMGAVGPGGLAELRLGGGRLARRILRRWWPHWERLFDGVQVFQRRSVVP